MVQIEKQLMKTMQVLAPERQRAVLDFAKFLEKQQVADGADGEAAQANGAAAEEGATRVEKLVDLAERGMGTEQAADLSARLHTFAEDWDRPEMAVYDEI